MGLTKVTTKITDLYRSGKYYENEFLVDTGATDCFIPANELEKVGIEPEGKDVYELASGETVEYQYGYARIEFLGFATVTKVVFAPAGVEPLMGVIVLEDLGFYVDPVKRTLKKMPAKPLK